MLFAIFFLSVMDAMAKWLVGRDINPIQILAVRSVLILPVMYLILWARGERHELRQNRKRAHVLRGLVGFTAPFCFFLSLRYLPLSDVVVVFFSSTLMITAMSHFLLKEQVGIHRWSAVVVGYIGVAIAIRPGGEGSLLGYLLVLAGSTSYALLFISGRMLSATESVASLVFSFNIWVGLVSALLLPWFWHEMVGQELAVTAVLAMLALLGHYLITMAFSIAQASVIAPFEYTALIWAVILDYFVWQQTPVAATWMGAAIIIGSGLYVLYRERRAEILPAGD